MMKTLARIIFLWSKNVFVGEERERFFSVGSHVITVQIGLFVAESKRTTLRREVTGLFRQIIANVGSRSPELSLQTVGHRIVCERRRIRRTRTNARTVHSGGAVGALFHVQVHPLRESDHAVVERVDPVVFHATFRVHHRSVVELFGVPLGGTFQVRRHKHLLTRGSLHFFASRWFLFCSDKDQKMRMVVAPTEMISRRFLGFLLCYLNGMDKIPFTIG